jgi:hypothetical protein
MQPKTLKLVLKGEVPEPPLIYELSDGTIIEIDNKRIAAVPSKKNEKKVGVNPNTGKIFVIPSEQHAKWLKEFRPAFDKFNTHIYSVHKIPTPLSRVKCKILFYFADSRTRDLMAKMETLADVMKDAGIIQDDEFKVMKPIHLDGWVDRSNPRTEIYLTIIPPSSPEYGYDKTPAAYAITLKARKNLVRKIRRDRKKRKSSN